MSTMTPHEMREELVYLRQRLNKVAEVCFRQQVQQIYYATVGLEVVEARDALTKAIQDVEELKEGLS